MSTIEKTIEEIVREGSYAPMHFYDLEPKREYYIKKPSKSSSFETDSFSPTKVKYIQTDSIDKYFISGGFIDSKGNAHGKTEELIEKANKVKKDYMMFMSSKEGKELEYMLADNTPYDGFIYTEMEEGILGANITSSDGRNYLAVNSRYYDSLSPEKKMLLYAHETIHKAEINSEGKSTEKSTEEKSAQFFNKLYQKFSDTRQGNAYRQLYQITSSRAASYN